MAGLKHMVGGEIKSYTEMTSQSREEAFNRMINQAVKLKADAVINVRFSTAMVMTGAAEMLAYGTAVKLKWCYEKFWKNFTYRTAVKLK